MAKVGKKYAEAAKKVDRTKTYSVEEAIKLAKETNCAKFDASVEVSFRLNVDPRHADQQIRGAMVLPHGTGRTQRVCVIAQGPQEEEAKNAGADHVGRVLGPKGLMPNPKTGTVTMDVAKAVEDIKKGKVEYRVDKEGNINLMIGKVSFEDQQLVENFNAIYNTIAKARPAAVKGVYMKNVVVSTTMGPGIRVSKD